MKLREKKNENYLLSKKKKKKRWTPPLGKAHIKPWLKPINEAATPPTSFSSSHSRCCLILRQFPQQKKKREMAGLVPPATTTIPADASKTAHTKAQEKTDYMNLPCPIPFEEIHREALS